MRTTWHSLREFEALRALIATGTATAAARRLGISQSAISRAVAQLESRTGHILFERHNGRLTATAEALALNQNLVPLFETLIRIDSGTWSMATGEPLRLIAPPTIAHHFLAHRIASFQKMHPDLKFSFEIATSDQLLAGIADHVHDIGFSDLPAEHAGVRFEPFLVSKAAVVFARSHPLARHKAISIAHLAGQPYIALTRRHRIRSLTDGLFAEAGIEPNIVVEAATSVALVELVRRGLGFAIVNPFPVLSVLGDDVDARPLQPGFTYQTGVLTSPARPLPAIGRAFIRHVRQTLGKSVLKSTYSEVV
jgi:DNA-binding transcriptional LysR family regulator